MFKSAMDETEISAVTGLISLELDSMVLVAVSPKCARCVGGVSPWCEVIAALLLLLNNVPSVWFGWVLASVPLCAAKFTVESLVGSYLDSRTLPDTL